MVVRDLGCNQYMAIDGLSGDKFMIYELTPTRTRLIEKRGNWNAPRCKMAWNKVNEFFKQKNGFKLV